MNTRRSLDRNEIGAILVAAGLAGHRDHALVSLLALNGLRISEALGAGIDDRGVVPGHRILHLAGGTDIFAVDDSGHGTPPHREHNHRATTVRDVAERRSAGPATVRRAW